MGEQVEGACGWEREVEGGVWGGEEGVMRRRAREADHLGVGYENVWRWGRWF